MTEAGLVVSDRFAFRSLGSVASLDDFGRYADSAFALGRSTFGHAESEEETVRHMISDYVALATDIRATVTDADARGLGLYRELNRFRFEQILDRRVRFVTTTTQNPKVERGVRSILNELVARNRIANWTLETEVLPGFYGQLLAVNQPDTAGSPFEHLDANAGDACSLLFALNYQPDD